MLYKYRTLDNFQFVLDILVNKRLYAATFEEMNDPMEGFYTADADIPSESIAALKEEQKSIKFCSLSKYNYSPLMWAHYANGNRGIAIGIEVKDDADLREVVYGSHSHLVASKPTTKERAKDVLSFKADFWRYEDEMRVFADKGNYVSVTVKEIIFGERANKTQKALLKNIIKKVNPKIKIIEWTDDMFYVHSDPVYKTQPNI